MAVFHPATGDIVGPPNLGVTMYEYDWYSGSQISAL